MYALPTNRRMKVMRFAHAAHSTREISGMESVGRRDREICKKRKKKGGGRKQKRESQRTSSRQKYWMTRHALFGDHRSTASPRVSPFCVFYFIFFSPPTPSLSLFPRDVFCSWISAVCRLVCRPSTPNGAKEIVSRLRKSFDQTSS